MAAPAEQHRSRWYRSFYWRIGCIFVVLVVGVIVAQSVMFSFMWARSSMAAPDRSPNNLATTAAADLGSALAQDPGLDLATYIDERYGRAPWPMFVVMQDGRTAGNRPEPLPEDVRRSVEAAVGGTDPRRTGAEPRFSGPVVTAPILVANSLAGDGRVAATASRRDSARGRQATVAPRDAAARRGHGGRRAHHLQARAAAASRARRGGGALRRGRPGGARARGRRRRDRAGRAGLQSHGGGARGPRRSAADLGPAAPADAGGRLSRTEDAPDGHARLLETLHMPEVAVDARTRDRYLATIERETRRLDRIVTDLLDLARHENGVGAFDVRLFAIERVFDHVVRRHERETWERDVTIRTDVADAADQVLADPDRIEQVIENLVANALRHTPWGGTIELRASASEDTIRLSVTDSGEGIAPEHVAHVFDRFYKVDAARAAGSGGSGLGLSIAKAIVERHGGTMEVTSEPGRTEFAVLLPQQAPAGLTHSASANL